MKVYAEVLEALGALARHEGWRAGTRLPPERELAELLGTSRPTVRKILERFECRGALSRRRRGGTVLLDDLDPALVGDGASGYVVSFVTPTDDNELYARRQRFLQNELLSQGYVLNAYLASQDSQDVEKERQYLRSLFKVRPKGLIIVATPIGGTNAALLAELAGAGFRIVHLDLYRDDLPAEPFVIPDWRLAGTRAVALARSWGVRRVVVANPCCGASLSARRTLEGVSATAALLGMEVAGFDVRCIRENRGSERLRHAVAALGEDVGVVAMHQEAAAMVHEEYVKLHGREMAARRIVAIWEHDEEIDPPPATPMFAFSWAERVGKAIRHISTPEKEEGPRLLLEPRLLTPCNAS